MVNTTCRQCVHINSFWSQDLMGTDPGEWFIGSGPTPRQPQPPVHRLYRTIHSTIKHTMANSVFKYMHKTDLKPKGQENTFLWCYELLHSVFFSSIPISSVQFCYNLWKYLEENHGK